MKKYIISLLLIILMVVIGVNQVNSNSQKDVINSKNKDIEIVVDKQEKIIYNGIKEEPNQIEIKEDNNYIIMQATGYDLSIQCCGKSYNHPSRGITRNGYNLNNKSHDEAWTVSSIKFPMGTKLRLEFPESHSEYSGIYIVRDTGNFNENTLDIYVGDFGEKVHKDTIEFSRVDVKVWVIED